MNFSGFGINKAFKTGIDPKKPYYYITASLDLSGAVFGGTYYFNQDNNFTYSVVRDYAQYVVIDENSIIGEVAVYANSELISSTYAQDEEKDIYLSIGGAKSTSDPVSVYWAAPAGFGPYTIEDLPGPFYNGYPLTLDEVNAGPVNYFGHEGGHFPYDRDNEYKVDSSKKYKFLAVTISDESPDFPVLQTPAPNADGVVIIDESKTQSTSSEPVVVSKAPTQKKSVLSEMLKQKKQIAQVREKKRLYRGLPLGNEAIAAGKLTVVLKVYPKAQ